MEQVATGRAADRDRRRVVDVMALTGFTMVQAIDWLLLVGRLETAARPVPERRARGYAAKWFAEGRGGEEPTDEALAETFQGCVRPARTDEYDAIRAQIQSWNG